MKVTLSAENKALEKQKKTLFAAHIKGLKLKDKQNTCISNNLKNQFHHFDHFQKFHAYQSQKDGEVSRIKFTNQKCKNLNSYKKNQQSNSKKPNSMFMSDKKEINFVVYNPEVMQDRLKDSINELKETKPGESFYSTKANSRQKSRATSVGSSTTCCKFIKIQRQEVVVSRKVELVPSSEKKLSQKKKKISKILSPQITKITRIIMLDWMFQLSAEIQLPRQALYNAIDYIDKYILQTEVKKSQYQKVGLACLFLATKLQMSSHPRVQIFLEAMDNQLDRQVLIETERKIVHTLKFRLNPPTLYQFMTVAMLTIKTFKSEYKSVGWVNDIPSVQKGNDVYNKMHWILDGVIIQGVLTHKYGKDEICLSILYISMLLSLKNSKFKVWNSNLIDPMRNESTALTQFSFSSIEKSSLTASQQEQLFNISYECFIRYATTSNNSLRDYQSCILDLDKWRNSSCSCDDDNSQYHEELKQLALGK